jgi:hypothetical protein
MEAFLDPVQNLGTGCIVEQIIPMLFMKYQLFKTLHCAILQEVCTTCGVNVRNVTVTFLAISC